MGDKWGSAENLPSDGGGGSWQEMAQSPDLPISTQENAMSPPRSPLFFLDYFHGPGGFNQMLGSKTQVYADCSMQPNDLLISDPYFGASTFNQLLLTPSNSQNPGCIVASQQPVDLINHHQYLAQNQQNLHKPLSKDQKRRLRLKEKEQEKDGQLASLISETETLKQQILRTNYELSYLRSENEMLRSVKDEQFVCLRSQNEMLRRYYEQLAQLISEIEMLRTNKDEQLARLVWEIEMLRKEIASIKN